MEAELYKNSHWSKADKELFFDALHQEKDDDKARYLNAKAAELLVAARKHSLLGAIELCDEAITGYPNKTEISQSYLIRARSYELLGKLKQADSDYEEAYTWSGLVSRDKMDAASQYLEFIVRHKRKKQYDKALLLIQAIERDAFRLIVHDFLRLAGKAVIARRRGKRLYRSANEALKLVQIRKYQNTKDTTGLVDLKRHAFLIDELLKIVK